MNNLKPKVKIDKFTGSGDGLLYYNEGFIPDNESGNSLMDEGYSSYKIFDNSDSGYSDGSGGSITSALHLETISSIYQGGGKNYRLLLRSDGRFIVDGNKTGVVGGIAFAKGASGAYLNSGYSDLFSLASNNIIFSSCNHLGLIIRGSATTNSSSTKIIDRMRRNFTTLGITTGMVVRNLTTGTNYTITSISDEGGTKDCLNFNAVADKTNTDGDEFMLILEQKWELNTGIPLIDLPLTSSLPRQINAYADYYYIANGHWLAKLAGDESTITPMSKELPSRYYVNSFDVNTDKILVSASTTPSIQRGSSENILLLWDGFSDGWNNEIKVDNKISEVKAYQSGWTFISGGCVYFTDGFSVQKLGQFSDSGLRISDLKTSYFNQIQIYKNNIYFCGSSFTARGKNGLFSFNPSWGFSNLNILYKNTLLSNASRLFINNIRDELDVVINGDSLSGVREGTFSGTKISKSFIALVDLKESTQIFGVGLNIIRSPKFYANIYSPEGSPKIAVSIGDGNGAIFSEFQGKVNAVGEITLENITTGKDKINVGDEIQVDPHNSSWNVLNGERTFVTAKTYLTGDDIKLQVSPVFSAANNNITDLKVIKVKSCGEKTITDSILNTEQMFFLTTPIYSNKIFIEVTLYGASNAMPISITGINIY